MAKVLPVGPEDSSSSAMVITLLVCGDADSDLQDKYLGNYGKYIDGDLSTWNIFIPTNIGKVHIVAMRGSSLSPDNFEATLFFGKNNGSIIPMPEHNFVGIQLHWLEGNFDPVSYWSHGDCNLWHPFDSSQNDSNRIAPLIQVIRLVTGDASVSWMPETEKKETTPPGSLEAPPMPETEKKETTPPDCPNPKGRAAGKKFAFSESACPPVSKEGTSSLALELGFKAISRMFRERSLLIIGDKRSDPARRQQSLDALFEQGINEIHRFYTKHVEMTDTIYIRHALIKDARTYSLVLRDKAQKPLDDYNWDNRGKFSRELHTQFQKDYEIIYQDYRNKVDDIMKQYPL